MNPLQEHPHLFANGEFKVWVEYEKVSFNIHAYNSDVNELLLYPDIGWAETEDCTLIARPIEDMTDEELKFAYGFDIKTDRERLIKSLKLKAKNGTIPTNQLLRMLSIGVYPFDQSHFEDGVVLDVREC